jgi:thiol-disulfide isomerase/thioredoxin
MRSPRLLAVLTAAALAGCADGVSTQTTSVPSTPADVVEATPAPGASAPAASSSAPAPPPTDPDPAPAAPAAAEAPASADVTLKRLTWDQFRTQVATNPNAKYTMVDAWATWCGPCKENFPHLVEMHKKFADKGLAVASLSFDDREDADAVAEAEKFLREQGATFTNVLLDEDFGVGNEKLDINGIPAVFLYGPDGKEVRRYTGDDPNNQFTYEQVEKDVAAMLEAQ